MPNRVAFEFNWSIGLYRGLTPFSLQPLESNPILTKTSVTDAKAGFVADPFHISVGAIRYLFFEVYNEETKRGEIAYATSDDGVAWTYRSIVLREPFHLSYPCVIRDGDELFMIPETRECQSIRLYRATAFPEKWEYVRDLIRGDFADATVFRAMSHPERAAGESRDPHRMREGVPPLASLGRDDLFYLFAHRGLDELRLYSSDSIDGDWVEHPASPIVEGNRRVSRPAGRVLNFDNRIIRFAQDAWPHYGSRVRAIEIDELTPTTYSEHEIAESPILEGAGDGWNSLGMHHVDFVRGGESDWLAVVDGFTPGAFYRLG
jgi:hypothetical protein